MAPISSLWHIWFTWHQFYISALFICQGFCNGYVTMYIECNNKRNKQWKNTAMTANSFGHHYKTELNNMLYAFLSQKPWLWNRGVTWGKVLSMNSLCLLDPNKILEFFCASKVPSFLVPMWCKVFIVCWRKILDFLGNFVIIVFLHICIRAFLFCTVMTEPRVLCWTSLYNTYIHCFF